MTLRPSSPTPLPHVSLPESSRHYPREHDHSGSGGDDTGGVIAPTQVDFTPTPTLDHQEGRFYYDSTVQKYVMMNEHESFRLNPGEEMVIHIVNKTGGQVIDGIPVRLTGAITADHYEFELADADTFESGDSMFITTTTMDDDEEGMATRFGQVGGVDTSAWDVADKIYLSTTLGELTITQPSPPASIIHMGYVVTKSADGTIFVDILPESLSSDFAYDGCATSKQEFTLGVEGGQIYAYAELLGGGDLPVQFGGEKYFLDCTTGDGPGGEARVALTEGTATTPLLNYVWVELVGEVATLTAGTSFPAYGNEFAFIGKATVFDDTKHGTDGAVLCQRTTDAPEHGGRGRESYTGERVREGIGAAYYSGCATTGAITVNGGSADNVDASVASGVIYQYHQQAFPALSVAIDGIYVANASGAGSLSMYDKPTDLNAILEEIDGTSLADKRFNLTIFGCANKATGDCKLFVNLPSGSYTTDTSAYADTDNTAAVSVPTELRSTAFLIARIPLRHRSLSNGTWTFLGTVLGKPDVISLLGNPIGVSGSGASTQSSEFSDSAFAVYNAADSTKELVVDVSAVSTGTERTLTMTDHDATLNKWQLISATDYTDTAPSSSTITMDTDLTAYLKDGMGIKVKLSGTYQFARIKTITSNLLTIQGAELTTGAADVEELWWCDGQGVIQADIFVADTYADGTTTTLYQTDMKSKFLWRNQAAYCVHFAGRQNTNDSGTQPKVNVMLNAARVSTADTNLGIQLNTTEVANGDVAINTTNYDIQNGETIELEVSAAGGSGDAEDLTISAVFVLE